MLLAALLLVISTEAQTTDLPQLPLVPYPQHVSLLSSPPAVIDPLRFTFFTQSRSVLLQEVKPRLISFKFFLDYEFESPLRLSSFNSSL